MKKNTLFKVTKMIDAQTKEELEVARHPLQQFIIKLPFVVHEHDMARLVNEVL